MLQDTEDQMSMTTFYYCSVNHQSGLNEKHIFKIIIYSFATSKCVANYVISSELYDGFIGQKILKLELEVGHLTLADLPI